MKRQSFEPITLGFSMDTLVSSLSTLRSGYQNPELVGIDIDPCALSEATHNVSLNGRGCQVMISKTPLERLAGCFSVIVANLAYPTLRRLSPHLSKRMEKGGVLILSGFKEPVAGDLGRTCAEQGLRLIGEETDRQWACLVLRKCGNMVWG